MIGLIQMRARSSREENLRQARQRIAEAAGRGATLIVLPEFFQSLYFCQHPKDPEVLATAEPIPGPTTTALSEAAKKHRVTLVGGSLFEEGRDGKRYNTCPVFGPEGSLLGTYRKTHIPEDPLYHEQHYFAPGDMGIPVFETPVGRIAALICYDQWFPEAARIAALKGAEIIVYPTAIGFFTEEKAEECDWRNAWETVQRGHAIANNVVVAAVNRVGTEGSLCFFGNSFVCDDFGTVLARGGGDEEIVLVTIDLARIPATREGWGFFRNRRPKMYGEITKEL